MYNTTDRQILLQVLKTFQEYQYINQIILKLNIFNQIETTINFLIAHRIKFHVQGLFNLNFQTLLEVCFKCFSQFFYQIFQIETFLS